MAGVFIRFKLSVFVALVLSASVASSLRADAPDAAWRPVANDPFAFSLDLSESLLNRGVPSLAVGELERIEESAKNASEDDRRRFGALAIRAAIESANLETQSGRDEAARRRSISGRSRARRSRSPRAPCASRRVPR